MRRASKIGLLSLVVVVMAALAAGVASAEEGSPSTDYGYTLGLAATVGEGMYFIDGGVYRSPVSLELVPSLGFSWFKFDLGLYTTVESLQIAGTNVGYWNFTFRPGGRLTPPMIPLYLRAAIPLQIQRHNFDWGVMFGLGADIPILGMLGIVLEADTTLSKDLDWGGGGIPLEFRAGLSFHL
ncbi:MAG: hypothetical protein C4523_18770 [Myxococcales bacterium]|nr:MAG: hypothetical protein C4523_18770 [Myxococcales bacterium]